MAQYAVLGDQRRAQGVRIFIEEAVMAYAQTDHDVEIGLFFIQELRLQDRIADVRAEAFLLRVEAYIGLPDCACLAGSAVDFETVVPEDCSGGAGFLQKPNACGDAQLLRADLAGKFTDFLNTCGPTVVFEFNLG